MLILGVLMTCLGNFAEEATAAKARNPTPCLTVYKQVLRKMRKTGAPHYAVATTGGRSLTSPNTGCGFYSGTSSESFQRKGALGQCNDAKRKWGYPGKCKLIESK